MLWPALLYLNLSRKFLCSGRYACHLGLRNQQGFFLFMTQACHFTATWNDYKAKPLKSPKGLLRATSNGGTDYTDLFSLYEKQIMSCSVCLATVACTEGSRIVLVFDVYSIAGCCGYHSVWHTKPSQSINAWRHSTAASISSVTDLPPLWSIRNKNNVLLVRFHWSLRSQFRAITYLRLRFLYLFSVTCFLFIHFCNVFTFLIFLLVLYTETTLTVVCPDKITQL